MKPSATADFDAYLERYNYTAYMSRRDWAYEHLRRIPAFEKAAWPAYEDAVSLLPACTNVTLAKMRRPEPEAEAWGLKFFPNPALIATKANVFWTDNAHLEKVQVHVSERALGEVDKIFEQTVEKCHVTHLTDWEGFEHLTIRGKGCSIQVRCSGQSLISGQPVKMSFDAADIDDIEKYTRVMEQSKIIYGDQATSPPLFTRKAKLMRNGLIALDGRRAGLTDRQIAWIIEGGAAVESGLAKGDRSLIRRVKTYRDSALAICGGGYRDLLRPKSPLQACA